MLTAYKSSAELSRGDVYSACITGQVKGYDDAYSELAKSLTPAQIDSLRPKGMAAGRAVCNCTVDLAIGVLPRNTLKVYTRYLEDQDVDKLIENTKANKIIVASGLIDEQVSCLSSSGAYLEFMSSMQALVP